MAPSRSRRGRILRATEFYRPPEDLDALKILESPAKNRKKQRAGAVKKSAANANVGTKQKKVAKSKASTKDKVKKVKSAGKMTKREKAKQEMAELLAKRTKLPSFDDNPIFSTRRTERFVSPQMHSKLAIQAARLNDMSFLKKLWEDKEKVSSLTHNQSVNIDLNAIYFAIMNENVQMVDYLYQSTLNASEDRVQETQSLLERVGTGRSNFYMLGRHTRKIQMTRGAREGNNALIKVNGRPMNMKQILEEAAKHGISFSFLKKLAAHFATKSKAKSFHHNPFDWFTIAQIIPALVKTGDRHTAGKLMEVQEIKGQFTDLFRAVLLNDKEELPKFMPVSVKKKAFARWFDDVTPLHCACINPDAKYLEQLMKVEPDFNHPDRKGFRAAHFAAACKGTAPLKLLLEKGASMFDLTKGGHTPLHQAAITNQCDNIKLIAEQVAKNSDLTNYLNIKNRKSHTALHLAASHGNIDAVKTLIQLGANPDTTTSAKDNKQTALMLACSQGHLTVVQFLISDKSGPQQNVNVKDKLKRTPLIHACLNGNAHIVAFLLRNGADADWPDSSGNRPSHYAAAYGWLDCLQLLHQCDADLNASNDWELTPLAVAYLKGHMGIVEWLLSLPDYVDVNAVDANGQNLVALSISAGVDENTLEQLEYLIQKKGVKACVDNAGNSLLHLLAVTPTDYVTKVKTAVDSNGKMTPVSCSDWEYSKKIDDLLINIASFLMKALPKESLCSCKNENDQTAADVALQQRRYNLALYFLKNGDTITLSNKYSELNENVYETCMHHLFRANTYDFIKPNLMSPFLEEQIESVSKDDKKKPHQPVSKVKSVPRIVMTSRKSTTVGSSCTPTQWVGRASELFEYITKTCDQGKLGAALAQHDRNGFAPIHYLTNLYARWKIDKDDVNQKTFLQDQIKLADLAIQCFPPLASIKTIDVCNAAADMLDSGAEEIAVEDYYSDASDDNENDSDEQSDCDQENDPNEEKKEVKMAIGFTPLHFAVFGNSADLLDKPSIDENSIGQMPLLKVFVDHLLRVSEPDKILMVKTSDNHIALSFAIRHKLSNAAVSLLPADLGLDIFDIAGWSATANHTDERKHSVLMRALDNQMYSVARRLIECGAEVNTKMKETGQTALHFAAKHSSYDTVNLTKMICNHGADVNAKDTQLKTPLHVACDNANLGADGNTDLLDYLFKNANLNSMDINGNTALSCIFIDHQNPENLSKIEPISLFSMYLDAVKSRTDYGSQAYFKLITGLSSGVIKLCQVSLMIPQKLSATNKNGNSVLHLAAQRGATICCMQLLKILSTELNMTGPQLQSNIDSPNNDGNTPLGLACIHADEMTALTLLQSSSVQCTVSKVPSKSADKDLDANRWLPMELQKPELQTETFPATVQIVQQEWQGMIHMLLQMNASADKLHSMLASLTSAAMKYGKYNLALLLLRRLKGFSLDKQGMVVKSTEMSIQKIAIVFAQNAAASVSKDTQETILDAILEIIDFGSTPALKEMDIETGPMFRSKMTIDDTVFCLAASNHNLTLINILKEKGYHNPYIQSGNVPNRFTSLFVKSMPPLHDEMKATLMEMKDALPTGEANAKCLQAVYFENKNNKKEWNVSNALCAAIEHEDFAMVKFLLKDLALTPDIFGPNGKMQTPLMLAVEKNHVDIIKLLLNPDHKTKEELDQEKNVVPRGGKKKFARKGRLLLAAPITVGISNDDEESESQPPKAKKSKGSKGNMASKKSSEIPIKVPIDLTAHDKHGNNIFHYIARNKWVNQTEWLLPALLRQLNNSSTLLTEHRNIYEDLTPMDVAGHRCNTAFLDVVSEFLCLESKMAAGLILPHKTNSFTTVISKSGKGPKGQKSFTVSEKDAEKFLAKQAELNAKVTSGSKAVKKPHKNSDMKETGEIVTDTENGQRMDVLLNKIDIYAHFYGNYSFYRMQLIKKKGSSKLYVLFTNWGRIGTDGEFQRTPFGSFDDGKKEFAKVFRQKTGNNWANLPQFDEVPKKCVWATVFSH